MIPCSAARRLNGLKKKLYLLHIKKIQSSCVTNTNQRQWNRWNLRTVRKQTNCKLWRKGGTWRTIFVNSVTSSAECKQISAPSLSFLTREGLFRLTNDVVITADIYIWCCCLLKALLCFNYHQSVWKRPFVCDGLQTWHANSKLCVKR